MNARDAQRHRARVASLRAHGPAYMRARRELRRIHEGGGQNPTLYLVRRTFILARTPEPSAPVVASPAAALAPMRGWALHLYLIALFETQAQHRAGFAVTNTRPLLNGSKLQAAWVDLLPAVTSTTPRSAGMRRQLVRALALLEQQNLVGLRGRAGFRGRYDYFRLRLENGGRIQGRESAYTVPLPSDAGTVDPAWIRPPGPAQGRSAVISLPASFFLNGWVHVLSAAEITTYLMLRDLEARYPVAGQAGVYANNPQRETWYGIHRDIYATHRQLTAYGLVDRLDAPARNPDGTIAPGGGKQMLQPYWFRTTPEGFDQVALPTLVDRLDLPHAPQPTEGHAG
ncbi:hypothetical protein [Micromonospora aurantiaca (nom. illeg.)]|uniref:hypothetical protein n=1 Tax=Micromonospora aurantiaca (nom. illeg.) TaxID=47850 RepID=UPI0036588FFF